MVSVPILYIGKPIHLDELSRTVSRLHPEFPLTVNNLFCEHGGIAD